MPASRRAPYSDIVNYNTSANASPIVLSNRCFAKLLAGWVVRSVRPSIPHCAQLSVEGDALAGRGSAARSYPSVVHAHFAAVIQEDFHASEAARRPDQLRDLDAAARAEAAHRAVRHVEGSAGRRSISAVAFPTPLTDRRLCMSISETPAVKAKFPSIWKGGWASNRFGYTPPPGP